jgi:hypothetical protein
MKEDGKMQVFLSHASEDKPKVRNLSRCLRDDGFDPWLDEERLLPGQDWSLEIEKALRDSDAILLCFSERSVSKSGFIQKEYKRAMRIQEEKPEGAIFVIPVRLDECEMPFFIRDLQWVDYPAGYDRLLLALNSKTGGTAMPKKPAARKPARKGGATKSSSGHTYNIQGGIHAEHVVMGDQTNYYQNRQTLNITTPVQFIEELKKLKDEIEQLKSHAGVDPAMARRINMVQDDLQEVIEEAAKPQPAAGRINRTLDGAKETMEKIGGSIGAAINLGTTLGNLALLAWKVFGGG